MTETGQVEPVELLFAQNWEDPESDRKALKIQQGEVMMTITSGGCNTLGFLLNDPGKIIAVDINACQSHLLELKICAMRHLDHARYMEFMGLRPSPGRIELYQMIAGDLSDEARAYWSNHLDLVQDGVLFNGKYERFVGLFRKFLRLIQGGGRVDGLFENDSIEKQRAYFDNTWNTRRFRAILSLFFNKHMLARRGLAADYFKFDDGSDSFADSFLRRARHVMSDLPVRDNYFLACYLLGQYYSETDVPDYLRRQNYDTIKSRLNRIEIVSADAKRWLEGQKTNSIHCFSLSNICEMMNLEETETTFREVARCGTEGARICFRNLMVPRSVPEEMEGLIQRNHTLSKQLVWDDRSFVYGKVDALQVSRK